MKTNLSLNFTGPEKITATYYLVRCDGKTITEYMRAHRGYKPLVQEIKLVNYELGTTNYKGEVLVRDIGWLKIDDGFDNPQHKCFTINISEFPNPEGIWIQDLKITKKEMTGYYEYYHYWSGIVSTVITFKALKK